MAEYTHVKHTFEPVYDENSKILILGSLPSVKSREQGLLEKSKIEKIYVNGTIAGKYYKKYVLPLTGMEATILQSTSPLNCRYNLEKLVDNWKVISDKY
ncbi:MAG: hypothetical protein IKL49_05990 [Lachnospiraceae bacterium]|nr:hypothetical protein [Lachnospiraceae bacterium]